MILVAYTGSRLYTRDIDRLTTGVQVYFPIITDGTARVAADVNSHASGVYACRTNRQPAV